LKHLNKHLPGTTESAKLIQKEGAAHVFTDKATLSQVEAAILERGQSTGAVRGTERFGLRFEDPIGYRISRDGNRIPLHYGELTLKPDGRYHLIPRTRPAE
jgi:hypothetical protein